MPNRSDRQARCHTCTGQRQTFHYDCWTPDNVALYFIPLLNVVIGEHELFIAAARPSPESTMFLHIFRFLRLLLKMKSSSNCLLISRCKQFESFPLRLLPSRFCRWHGCAGYRSLTHLYVLKGHDARVDVAKLYIQYGCSMLAVWHSFAFIAVEACYQLTLLVPEAGPSMFNLPQRDNISNVKSLLCWKIGWTQWLCLLVLQMLAFRRHSLVFWQSVEIHYLGTISRIVHGNCFYKTDDVITDRCAAPQTTSGDEPDDSSLMLFSRADNYSYD